MMSNTGEQKKTLVEAIRHLYKLGGVRAYYRGLTVRAFLSLRVLLPQADSFVPRSASSASSPTPPSTCPPSKASNSPTSAPSDPPPTPTLLPRTPVSSPSSSAAAYPDPSAPPLCTRSTSSARACRRPARQAIHNGIQACGTCV